VNPRDVHELEDSCDSCGGGARMIEQGTDCLSRGDMLTGVVGGADML
jgi:hypothetical protein